MVDKVRESFSEITLTGSANGDATVSVLVRDAAGNALWASGTTVPSGTAGYAVGCIFTDTDASTAATVIKVNTGTATSCTFSALA